jgi:hypothetical protein
MAIHHTYKGIATFSLVSQIGWKTCELVSLTFLFVQILASLVLSVGLWTFVHLLYRNNSRSHHCHNQTNSSQSILWGEFEKMPHYFQWVIVSCDWIAVGGALLQIVLCFVIVCSSPEVKETFLSIFILLFYYSQ